MSEVEHALEEVIQQSSVELSTDSKGKIKIAVKSYNHDIKQAKTEAETIFDSLVNKYKDITA